MSTNKKLGREMLSKRYKKIIAIVGFAILVISFVPFERRLDDKSREYIISFTDGINYKEEEYYDLDHYAYGECLSDAKHSSYGKENQEAFYEEESIKCSKAYMDNTGKVINKIKFGNGFNATTNNEYGRDYSIFIGDDGNLYKDYNIRRKSGDEYMIIYSDPINYNITSGSAITINVEWTVACRVFGLICDYENKVPHDTLIVGENATIEKYSKTCDYYSPEYPLDGSGECIYKNDTPAEVKLSTLLKSL